MARGFTIAVSGKGGVGKTNISALIIRCLSKVGSVLAIDADPDSNLPHALGIEVSKNVGAIREGVLNMPYGRGGSLNKQEAFTRAISDIIEETDEFDIIAMGRSEGEGCYCPINSILSQTIDLMVDSYDFTVIDCEAGLEHLSRRTTRDVDIMLVVTEPTMNGLLTASRVKELAKELHIDFGEIAVVANKITPEVKPLVDKMAGEKNIKVMAYVPFDPALHHLDTVGEPIIQLPEDSPASQAIVQICDMILEHVSNIDSSDLTKEG